MNNDRIEETKPEKVHNTDNQTSRGRDEIRRRSSELTSRGTIEQTTTDNLTRWSAEVFAQSGAGSLLRCKDIHPQVKERLKEAQQENTDNTVVPGSSKLSFDSHKIPLQKK